MGGARFLVWGVLLGACGTPGLTDDDVPPPSGVPVLDFDSTSSSFDETHGELTLWLHLSEPTNELVTFSIDLGGSATEGSDYRAVGAGLVLIPPGVDIAWVIVQLFDDGVPEPSESIEFSLSAPINCEIGNGEHTLTIRDNLVSRVTFEYPNSGANENTPGSVNLLVMPASPVPMTVDYTLSGTASSNDHGLQNGTITIPAGVTSWPFSFEQIDDALDEDDEETIIVTLTNPSHAIIGTTPTNTHKIYDNDASPNVAFVVGNNTVNEGDSGTQSFTVEVRLDRISGRDVSVNFGGGSSQFFSGTLGVDYTIMTPSPLVFPAGTTSQTITFAILGDTVQDGSDQVAITLQGSGQSFIGFPGSHVVQVDNDDCYAVGGWRVCPDTAPATDLMLDSTGSINTSFNSNPCAARQPPGWIASGHPPACFIVARNITIGTARFEGFRPIVLVALDSISVSTLLDAGSHGLGGPGHNPAVCGPPPTLNAGAGGGGGSFTTAGGNGGNKGSSAPGGTAAPAVSAPMALRGGCPGQLPDSSSGGLGGGAVYLVAGNTITIAPNATINASGSGGAGGFLFDGGNGGGSGGMIILWAQSIVASQARLLANGGGGGEGATGTSQTSPDGAEVNFSTPLTPAAGGTGTQGGDGGAGAVQGVAATSGSNGNSQNAGGGGGGGLGYLLVHPSLSSAVTSPTPATF